MKRYKKNHSAFSLIEIIFVLIILGIVSSIGSSIIIQVYESYIIQNSLYKVTTKTELVANQIVNRLSYAIPLSTISKATNENGTWSLINATPTEGGVNGVDSANSDWIQLKNIMFDNSNKFRTIEWIGYDNDSFSAKSQPAWSGIADYPASTKNNLVTPGSELSLATTIIAKLSNSQIDLDGTSSNSAAIIFQEKDNHYNPAGERYHPSCMGLIDNDSSCIFPVQRLDDTNLTFIRVDEPKIVTERYKLVWSAYAIVPEDPDGDNLWDLYLYSNYQPWNGENYKANGTKKLLMNNISVFKFTKNGGIIQFKICATAITGSQAEERISTCKEKVVLR